MQDDYLIGRTVHGNLLIKARIGEGGMGQVYLASNVEVQERRYAVKILKRELTHDASFASTFTTKRGIRRSSITRTSSR